MDDFKKTKKGFWSNGVYLIEKVSEVIFLVSGMSNHRSLMVEYRAENLLDCMQWCTEKH